MNGVLGIHAREGDAIHCYGSKGLRLRDLAMIGFEVPDGFLISVECISWLVKACGMDRFVFEIVALEASGESNLEEKVKEAFQNLELDKSLIIQFMDLIERIQGFHPEMFLAVRSAAVGEDDGAASYAGQYSTVLEVSPKNLFDAIFECYASWWSDRVMVYRRQKMIAATEPQLSVIVQRQLAPDYAGVLFTRHPISGKKGTMMVEAVEGLGDKLVSGEVSPGRWEISEKSGVFSCSASQKQPSSSEIDPKYLKQLYDIGTELEKHFGQGMDMEWAIEKNLIYVLQARPITTGAVVDHKDPSKSADTPIEQTNNIYSRAIVEDLWADRMSDITGSIVFDEFAELFTFKTVLRKLKLNHVADMEVVKVINGYGYLNSQAVAMLMELIPPSLRFMEIARMFPGSIQKRVLETKFNLKKAIGLVLRVPLLMTDPAIIPFLTRSLLKKHLTAIESELNRTDVASYSDMTLKDLGDELERVLKLQGKLQERNQWGYGNTTFFTWLLRHLATKVFKKSEQWVLDQITHIPPNVTVRSQKRLKSICRMCDEELIEKAFRGRDGKEVWQILSSEFPAHPVTRAIQSFINTYRFRSANRDFIHPRWDEAPDILAGMMSVMIGSMKKTTERDSGSAPISEPDPYKIQKRSIKMSSILLSPLVYATRNFLSLREDLRFCLDKIFYRIRKILLAISQTPEFANLKKIPDGVFFLKLNELREIFSNKTSVESLLAVVAKRRKTFFEEQDRPTAYCLRIDKPLENIVASTFSTTTIFSGVPASSGVAEGVARVIRSSDEFHLLKPGEILVAFNTDPGWTPLFMSAAGVIVEMGGILNHCAIVAREYGIPAVVGVEEVSRRIETGRKVRIDGNSGIVELL